MDTPESSTNSIKKSKFSNLDLKLIIWFAFATIFSIILRYFLFPYTSSDIQNFLVPAIESLQETGEINIEEVTKMDVNFVYIYLVSTFSYFTNNIVLSVKILNTIFDILLSLGVWAIIKNYSGKKIKAVSAYTISLFTPSLLIVSGMIGQMDTIVSTLLVWMLYSVLKNRVLISVILFAFAISLKWWAIFLLPFLLAWFVSKKRKYIYTLILIPAIFIIFVIPITLQGTPFFDSLNIYSLQSENITSINDNIPNFNNLLKGGSTVNSTFNSFSGSSKDNNLFDYLNQFSYLFTALIASFLLWLSWVFKPDWGWIQTVRFALFSSLLLTFLLPNVFSSYFVISSILCLIYSFLNGSKFWYFMVIELITLLLIVSDSLSSPLFVDKSIVTTGLLILIISVGYELVSDFEEFKTLREKVALLSSKYLVKHK